MQEQREHIAAGGAKRIHLEPFPGYAPDLNPGEGIWSYLQYRELKTVVCQNLIEVRYELRLTTACIRSKVDVSKGWITQAGLTR
jgi:transposase